MRKKFLYNISIYSIAQQSKVFRLKERIKIKKSTCIAVGKMVTSRYFGGGIFWCGPGEGVSSLDPL
jgi:hypothetical protein